MDLQTPSPTPTTAVSEATPAPRPVDSTHRIARGPMIALLISALTATACEICLKLGAIETAAHPTSVPWLGISGLSSKWVWLGIVFTILSFGAWVRAIRVIPLSIAYTLSNAVHVFIPLGCWWILGETISPRRWVGIALVIVGLIVIARPFAKLDEKLSEAL